MYSSSWVYLDCALLDTGKKVEVCWVLLYCFTLLSARVSEAPQCQPVSALVAINISSDIRLQFTTPVPTLYTRGLNFITEISTYQHQYLPISTTKAMTDRWEIMERLGEYYITGWRKGKVWVNAIFTST